MHRRILAVGLALALTCVFVFDVQAQEPKGSENWGQGTVTAMGFGVPPTNARSKA